MRKHQILLTVTFSLLTVVSVIVAQAAGRVFTFTPNPKFEQTLSNVGRPINARITATLLPYFLGTNMVVTPQALNLQAPKASKSISLDDRTIQIKLHIPAGLVNGDVPLTAFKLNGQLIFPVNPPPQNRYKLSSDFVHLYFDRTDTLAILGSVKGDRVVTLEANIAGAGFLTAQDVVKLLPTK